MISPDLAAAPPGPIAPRAAGKPADAAPERAFEAFVAGEPAAAPEETAAVALAPVVAAAPAVTAVPDEAVDLTDLTALLDAPAIPAPPALIAPVLAPASAAPPVPAVAPVAIEAGKADVETPPVAANPERTPAAAITAAAPAPTAPPVPPIGADGAVAAQAPVVEPEAEPDPEPDTATVRTPGAAASPHAAPVGGEVRPMTPGPAPAGFELSAPAAAAQSWRLSAASVEATRAAGGEPAPTASPRDVAAQITVAIAQSTQPQLEIRLDPPELGRVQIRLNPTEHGVQALVLADRPETQEFLRRHADVLARDLTDAGYAQVSLDFAAGGEAPPRDAPVEARRFGVTFDSAAVATPAPPEASRRVAAAGLDIRL